VRESRIEARAVEAAGKLGVWTTKFNSASRRGVPDRVFIWRGTVVFVEFKAPGETPTPLQRAIVRQMLDNGARVFVIDSLEQVKRFFWQLLAGTLPTTNITNENKDH
jgi:hypothetical protein